MRLGMEAAHGTEVDWSYRPTWWAAAPHGRCLEGEQIEQNQSPAVATLQFNYSTCPKGQLRHVTVLESAVQDMLAAVRWMKAKYPSASRLILAGFSFGGPVCWAAAKQLPRGAVHGIVSLAGSARGGPDFESQQLDTQGGVEWHTGASLFLHGTHDTNVALQVGEFLYRHASEPRVLVVVKGSTHHFDTARSAVYPVLRDWVFAIASGGVLSPCTTGVHTVSASGGRGGGPAGQGDPSNGSNIEYQYDAAAIASCAGANTLTPAGNGAAGDAFHERRDVSPSAKQPQEAHSTRAAELAALMEVAKIGMRVERRRQEGGWGEGYITSLSPLLVTGSATNPYSKGSDIWQDVRLLSAARERELELERARVAAVEQARREVLEVGVCGMKICRRFVGNSWGVGFITELRPRLRVTISSTDPTAYGCDFPEVP